jgi:hypothetical protein
MKFNFFGNCSPLEANIHFWLNFEEKSEENCPCNIAFLMGLALDPSHASLLHSIGILQRGTTTLEGNMQLSSP